jgi:hypothetical protein
VFRFFLDSARHRSEQYLTASQFFAHALRQAIGRLQFSQIFSGSVDFVYRSFFNDDFFMMIGQLATTVKET